MELSKLSVCVNVTPETSTKETHLVRPPEAMHFVCFVLSLLMFGIQNITTYLNTITNIIHYLFFQSADITKKKNCHNTPLTMP